MLGVLKNIKGPILRFFKRANSNQASEPSEKELDLFILQIFNKVAESGKFSGEDFNEIIFMQKFDRELKEKLKLDITKFSGRKMTKDELIIEGKQIAEILLKEFKRIMKEVFVENNNILRKQIVDSGNDIDAKLRFYYDETNNPRKFWIKENEFNSPANKNFILGGVVIDEDKFMGNLDDLNSKLKLQKNIIDMKARHIFKSPFLKALKSKKLNMFLKWISENEVYIHFINVDNFFIISNDILNIIINENIVTENIEGLKHMHGHTLHELISMNLNEVCGILAKYDYPKIQKDAVPDFCDDWVSFLERLKSSLPFPKNKIEELSRILTYNELGKLFEMGKNNDDFVGLRKNQYIIEGYSKYYEIKPDLFRNSFHIFDEETEVEKHNNYITSNLCFEKDSRVTFKGSHEDKFIQISDVVVGLLSDFFEYIEELNDELESGKIVRKLVSSISKFDRIQKENFFLLTNVLKKSYDKNRCFFYSENTFVQKNTLDFILRIIDITDDVLKFKAGNN